MLFFGIGLYGNLQRLVWLIHKPTRIHNLCVKPCDIPTSCCKLMCRISRIWSRFTPRFNYYDPQWAKVDAGGYFNVSYIVESLLLPISFFMHLACYIQKKQGK